VSDIWLNISTWRKGKKKGETKNDRMHKYKRWDRNTREAEKWIELRKFIFVIGFSIDSVVQQPHSKLV
jgi:hypothetical protein